LGENEEATRLRGSSWEDVEPVEEDDGEGVEETDSTHGVRQGHRNSVNIWFRTR